VVVVLWVIVVAGIGLAAGYAGGVPPWNAPDEPAHYNYVRHVAATGDLPVLQQGDWDAALLERLKSTNFPPSESIDSIRYESWQPPLYYLLASPLHRLTGGLPLDERVLLLRLLSVAISGLTVVLGFLAVRAVFPQERALQLAVAGFVAFLPMRSAIAGSVSNDALAEMLATLMLLAALHMLGGGFTGRRALGLGVLIGVALLTKMSLYGYIPLVLLAAALAPAGKGRGGRAGSKPRLLGVTVGVALLVGGWWFVRNAMVYGGMDLFGMQRHDQVVVGQLRPEQFDGAWVSYLGTTLFKSFWGQFGWMGILIDERLYLALGLVSALAAFGFALFLVRVVFGKGLLAPQQRSGLLLMGLWVGVAVAELVAYNLSFVQAQGRYLYPALLPIALFFVLGLRELLAPVHSRLLLALGVAALALLNFICLTRYVLPYFAGWGV
jgi:4-amino-4-deoxy-L-arabinose transferase-like glycosyltransferase